MAAAVATAAAAGAATRGCPGCASPGQQRRRQRLWLRMRPGGALLALLASLLLLLRLIWSSTEEPVRPR